MRRAGFARSARVSCFPDSTLRCGFDSRRLHPLDTHAPGVIPSKNSGLQPFHRRGPTTNPQLRKGLDVSSDNTDTRREAQPNPSMAIIVVAHGKPLILRIWASEFVSVHIDSIGEEFAWDEAYPDPIDGVWVCELRLVDDGPSDWTPEIRDCRLDASELRPPTPEEWARLIADEYVWDGEIPASHAGPS